MFRQLVRKNKQLSNESCIELLKTETRGVLSVLGDDVEQITDIVTKLSYRFVQDDEYSNEEIRLHGHRTLLMKLTPEHMCGKLVTES